MEIFRRSLAAFLVLVFVLFSVVTFTFFAFNNTFLKAAFYTDNLSESGYEFVIDQSAKMIYRSDEFISKNFTESDLKREISNVFSKDIFKKISKVDGLAARALMNAEDGLNRYDTDTIDSATKDIEESSIVMDEIMNDIE